MEEVRKPIIVTDKRDCIWGCQLNDGRIIVTNNPDYFLRWDTPIELDGVVTTLNDLVEQGKASRKLVTCYDEHEIDPFGRNYNRTKLSEKKIKSILKEFAEHGFNVTRKALMHNYEAWLYDEKSGYRDEENGYHLFSPCGCNPLSFRASSLDERCADWQTTYTC